ncbi:hypothetical protein H8958_004199 [Nasalis larvatus]
MKIPTGWPDQRGRPSGVVGAARYPVQAWEALQATVLRERWLPCCVWVPCPPHSRPALSVFSPASLYSGVSIGGAGEVGALPGTLVATAGLLAWFHEMEHCTRLCSERWASSLGWRGLYPCWPERWWLNRVLLLWQGARM